MQSAAVCAGMNFPLWEEGDRALFPPSLGHTDTEIIITAPRIPHWQVTWMDKNKWGLFPPPIWDRGLCYGMELL